MCQETTPTQAAPDPAPGDRSSDGLRRLLIGGAGRVFAVKIAAVALSVGVSVLLARLLGRTGFGEYTYALVWMGVLLLPATCGLNRLLVREIPAGAARSDWSAVGGIIRWADRTTLGASLAVALIASVAAWLIAGGRITGAVTTFWLAMALLLPAALLSQRQAALRALHHAAIGQIPETVVRPLLLIGLVLLLATFTTTLTPPTAMAMHLVAAAAALGLGWFLRNKHMPRQAIEATPTYRPSQWMTSAVPMLLVGGMQLLNVRIDILMLGAIRGRDAVAVYRAAGQGAMFIIFVVTAVNTVLAPVISHLHTRGDRARLQRTITRSARAMVALAALLATGTILLRGPFMAMFGSEFADGSTPLVILCIGQFINAATGPVAILLTMTGHERDAAWCTGLGAGLNITLNAALIGRFGTTGAAVATATSIAAMNLAMVYRVWVRLRIHSTALAPLRRRR